MKQTLKAFVFTVGVMTTALLTMAVIDECRKQIKECNKILDDCVDGTGDTKHPKHNYFDLSDDCDDCDSCCDCDY